MVSISKSRLPKCCIIIGGKYEVAVVEGTMAYLSAERDKESEKSYSFVMEGDAYEYKEFDLRKDKDKLERLLGQILINFPLNYSPLNYLECLFGGGLEWIKKKIRNY